MGEPVSSTGPPAKRSLGPMLLNAARRFVLLLAGTAFGTVVVSLLIGLLLGSSVSRSVSVGFYLVGAMLLIFGFFVGNRGPIRVKGEPGFGMLGFFRDRQLRWATGSEQFESLSLSVVFVALGLVLIILGIVTDTRYKLY
jgi:hypothetical protein